MMIDKKEYLDDGSAAITTDGDTNVLDFGAADPNPGDGTKLKWHVYLNTAFTSASNDLTIKLEHSDDDSTYYTLLELDPIELDAAANQVAQEIITVGLPKSMKRYVKATYVFSDAAGAAGKIVQWIGT